MLHETTLPQVWHEIFANNCSFLQYLEQIVIHNLLWNAHRYFSPILFLIQPDVYPLLLNDKYLGRLFGLQISLLFSNRLSIEMLNNTLTIKALVKLAADVTVYQVPNGINEFYKINYLI